MYREGYPNIRTVDFWLGGNKSERFPQSRYFYPVASISVPRDSDYF